jgi:hypothetical protein
MKQNLILTLGLCILSIQGIAQMNVSTNLRQDGIWDTEKEEWKILSTDEDEMTFFEFNKEFTMFKHTTASVTSAYIIKTSKKDEDNNQYEMDIVSDVGNKYLMILDIDNNNIRFFYEDEGELYMVHHTIKKVWFDED